MSGFPKMVAADVPGVAEMHYLVDENFDFISEAKRFLDYKRSVGRAPNTIMAYCSRLRYFYQFLSQKRLSVLPVEGKKQADSADLVEFLIWLCNPYRDTGKLLVQVAVGERTVDWRAVSLPDGWHGLGKRSAVWKSGAGDCRPKDRKTAAPALLCGSRLERRYSPTENHMSCSFTMGSELPSIPSRISK